MVKFQPNEDQLVADLPLWAVYSFGGENYLKMGKRFGEHWGASVHLRTGEVLMLSPCDRYEQYLGVLKWEE